MSQNGMHFEGDEMKGKEIAPNRKRQRATTLNKSLHSIHLNCKKMLSIILIIQYSVSHYQQN